jgi:uncharacterized protein YjbI with pentapeptide repeats
MKTIKPQKLALLTRSYEFRRKYYFGVSVLMFVPFSDQPNLYSEIAMWKFVASELGKDAAIEASIPKAQGEFLVSGSAFVPGGEPKQGCTVKVKLGEREKSIHVFGDRFWRGTSPGEPLPFSTMPLDWTHAFGGEGFDRNPFGKGVTPVSRNDITLHPLPNIQLPYQPLLSPNDRPDPAGFGPLDIAWPQRFSKAGTHDDCWLKEDFPGYARDIDWTMFNLASSDQWFKEPLVGDETFILENLHPTKPLLKGRLQGLKARCFVNRKIDEEEKFTEISTALKTVWFFPHAESAILIHQGVCEVSDEDAADILHLVVGAESIGDPKPSEHYRSVLAQRLDKEKGHLFALRDRDLLPVGIVSADSALEEEKALLEGEELLRKNLGKRAAVEIEKARAVVAGYGLDPDIHAPGLPKPEEPLPDMDHLSEYIEKTLAEAEEQKKAAQEGAAKSMQETEKLFESLGMDFNVIREEVSAKPKGPPDFSAQAQLDAMKDIADKLRAIGLEAAEIDGYLADEEFCNRLFAGERKLKDAYRITAQFQDPALPMAPELAQSVRRSVQDTYDKERNFAGVDLCGADLSGMDLHGANFDEAFLDGANLESTDLSECTFRRAVLAHAFLKDARLTAANLERTNLGGARLLGTDVSRALLERTILAKADLTGATFKGSQLHGVDFSGAVFNNTDLSESVANELCFIEVDLRGLILRGTQLEKGIFLKVDVSGVDFSGSNLTSAVFLEAQGNNAKFRNADMTNVRFVQQCSFESADFSGACLNKANLRGSRLSRSDFSKVQLTAADLSECDMQGVKLYRAYARDARFVKSDLRGALMTSINAINASLQRADIRGADLRGANMFQVDLARVWADTKTNLADANTKKVRIYPRRIS